LHRVRPFYYPQKMGGKPVSTYFHLFFCSKRMHLPFNCIQNPSGLCWQLPEIR